MTEDSSAGNEFQNACGCLHRAGWMFCTSCFAAAATSCTVAIERAETWLSVVQGEAVLAWHRPAC